MKRPYRAALAALLLLAGAAAARAADSALDAGMPAFPPLTGPVVDEAHLLPPAEFETLSQKLAAYARDSGNQMVVVTLPTLNGYPIEYYGYQLGRHWGIGEKGKNNGVLLIVDVGEKQVRIEVGYGLEGTLTDAQSFQIIHNVITPHFRRGDYAGGIRAGVNALLAVLGNSAQSDQAQKTRNRSSIGVLMLFIILFALWPLASVLFFGASRWGGGGWWLGGLGGWGGGFGGGGFGGFSGGGGSFGGGGASGGW